jgi:hypothetical protein
MKVEIVDHSDDDKGAKARDETRLIHRKQELYEFSIVNIPANPSASVRREVEMSSPIVVSNDITGYTTTTTIPDGAWSVRGLGYKQQSGYIDVEHEAIRKEIALMNDTIAAVSKAALSPIGEEVVLEDGPDEAEKKAANGILADMALRLDDVEDLIKGLIERVGVAEPESKPGFYEGLFKGSRTAPSALDQLLMPAKKE